MNFGVHHQAYKNFNAVENVLSQFRKYHPEDPYVLWSDSGSDYSEIAEKYKVCIESMINICGINAFA